MQRGDAGRRSPSSGRGARAELPFATREEALTLASIVDKETAAAGEREKVAAVFVNRLRARHAAAGRSDRDLRPDRGRGPARPRAHAARLGARERLQHLPRSPACRRARSPIPGRASIEAVLNPADVDYLYFVADGSGGHAFARTLDEHNRNVATWRKIRTGDVAAAAGALAAEARSGRLSCSAAMRGRRQSR